MNRSLPSTAAAVLTVPVSAQNVEVTPLGGIDGECCPMDRALVFEDPNGRLVTGSEMPAYLAAKLKANGGDPANSIAARFGGSVTTGPFETASVHVPMSGVTMEFTATATCACAAGC